jgi:hypothetical protein
MTTPDQPTPAPITSAPISPATSVPTRRDRIAGGLLGVHAGDALGATCEFMSWDAIRTGCSTSSAVARSTGRPGTPPTTPT